MKDATAVSSCEFMGFVSDTDYGDLAKKAGELRGTHAVIFHEEQQRGPFGAQAEREYAEVYRCGAVSQR
jgi:hypothetical protein